MESAPLTKAHDHARNAAVATQTSDTTVAINEHALAAGEFSNAASATGSAEALRTLRLLEQHHRRLSELLKLPLDQASQQSIPESELDIGGVDEKQSVEGGGETGNKEEDAHAKADEHGNVAAAAPGLAKPVPTLMPTPLRRYPGRNLSSSIASNLASARGPGSNRSKYRSQPLSPSVSNDLAPGSLEVHPRREGSSGQAGQDGKPSWVPPAPAPGKSESSRAGGASKQEVSSPNPNEEGFSRFYNSFGSIIQRLSAPLAFAGLPLISEESAPEPVQAEPSVQKKYRHRSAHSASTDPDLSKLYSRATLRALAKDGRGPQDSFYVVPTTGHTASYANILTYDQKEKRRMASSIHSVGSFDSGRPEPGGIDEVDEDDFVDARESPGSPTKRCGGGTLPDRDKDNAIEELRLENSTLKETMDKLTKRLHAFELNSQSSHLALAQSIHRMQRPGSPVTSSGVGSGSKALDASSVDEATLKQRNRELEDQLAAAAHRMDALERECNKQHKTLMKYRERWEDLKAGAKARRLPTGGVSESPMEPPGR